ncbi:hypothetical protein CJ030_MR4G004182 [Morella rubra]|uniref:Uncharacterized protein n=1 Tax=Morella rubra TaxID=262757 RepID=A0A6A1VR29_9ROSI|nr:hypothetical protein CJ030_MR4G004182 [Morella rubra]
MESTEIVFKDKCRKRNENIKYRFFPCFRPVAMGCSVKTRRCMVQEDPGNPFFAGNTVGEKEGMVSLRIFPPIVAADLDKEGFDGDRRKKGGKGRLSRILKAVFIENSLAKKIRRRKIEQSSFRSETATTADTVETSNSVNENPMKEKQNLSHDDHLRIESSVSSSLRRSSAFTSTSSCSSSSWSHTSNRSSLSERPKSFRPNSVGSKEGQDKVQVQEHRRGYHVPGVGLCSLLLSILVLIFWGKICAIFCTSALFSFLIWSTRCHSPEDGMKPSLPDTDEL